MPEDNGTLYTDPPQSRNEAIVEAIINETEYTDPPQSENEEILVSILNRTSYEKPPKSRFSDLLLKLKAFIEGGGGGRPQVPQTGTWQFKTTSTKGFLIIGKDDDIADQAKFVRMVNGYGYPVTLNTESVRLDERVSSDSDTANSLYPSGTTANFPNGTTIKDLAKFVNANGLGEIAQHDESSKTLWSSANLDDYMDGFFDTYTSGGGTKTKAELKEAILDKYADTDIVQGASRVTEQRAILEEALGFYILTIGQWGGTPNIIIDGITVGTFQNLKTGYNTLARQNNYFADSYLADYSINKGVIPFKIIRESNFSANNAEALCEALYSDRRGAELFVHSIVNTDTAEEWQAFKAVMDKIKTYVDAGKIQVVTRKGLAALGEYVANPIKSVSLTTDAVEYQVGATITEANFVCKATLNDNTQVNCESDRILDLSSVDTTTAGAYTVTMWYRGFKTTCTVTVVSSSMTLPEYVQQQTSGYYQTFRFTNDTDKCYCIYLTEASTGFNGDPYTYGGAWIWRPAVSGKNMRIFYSADGSATWTELCNKNSPASLKSNVDTYFGERTFTASQELTLSNVVHITS